MTITLDGITLPADLYWSDEYEWVPIESSQEYAITGALVIDAAARIAGRPITLEGATDRGWMLRSVLQQVYALTTPADRQMTLVHNGSSYTVVFRAGAESITAQPIFPLSNPQSDLPYVVTLRFTEV
jgi:hypothetical protein